MAVTLDQIVPWGRSMPEYVRMFDLTPNDLAARILDCAGGPSSFNAEMTRSGRSVVSCDPLYRYSAEEISGRIEQTGPAVLAATRANLNRFVWDEIKSPEDLLRVRRAAMELFLGDLPGGLAQQRYIGAELPALPFADQQFSWLYVPIFSLRIQTFCRLSSTSLRFAKCAAPHRKRESSL